ncbi:MAG TPA: hypothetical protein VLX58_12195 [Bryobacteraceae bacterium]|nr:hypothetical protein [Bryobacteraceae bacterium]
MANTQKAEMGRPHELPPLDACTLRHFAETHEAGELRVFMPHTSIDLTRAALSTIAALARDLTAHITLIAVKVVPFPLPLNRPDVSPGFIQQQLVAVAREIDAPVDVQVVIARDLDVGLRRFISTGSLVVVATKKRPWWTAETRLARSLAQAGHSVALLGV